MSFQITEAFVKQYSSNVFHLSQQKGSKLRGAVRSETQVGKSAFYDRIGRVAAQLRTTRHGDTPRMDTPHDRRKVDLFDYEWADLVDDQDKIRMLMDPTSMYAQAAAWALGRAMDERIIKALGGQVATGEEGTGDAKELQYLGDPDSSPKSQRIVAITGDGATENTADSLTVLTLRKIKKILDGNDVDESIRRYIVVNAAMLESLLGEESVTSSDYNTVKALVQGEINSFMGFEFIRTELLPFANDPQFSGDSLLGPGTSVEFNNTAGGSDLGTVDMTGAFAATSTASSGLRVGYAWAMDGCLLATGNDITGEIARRADKSFATQVYAKMSIGAVRMEEEKVVQFLCAE